MALKLPIIGVHSLDILAAGQPALEMPLWAMLHAGRGLLAFSPYVHDGTEWVRQADAVVITARDLEDRITGSVYVCGEMTPQERQILGRKWKTVKVASPSRCLRRPAVLAELTWKKLQADEVEDPVSITPIYLHTSTPIPG